MTLDQAQQLRPGDLITNEAIGGPLTVIGDVYDCGDGDVTMAIPCTGPQFQHITPSFVNLSTLVRRAFPECVQLPEGV